ncbi:AAA family ATPase [Desulfohalovibrio reitneri]|uniref:AAA family ATPase n=1 Tax=Desulfohalovibrio reitneri TaxID=1307759 RepID=UPI0004A6FDE0|nr:ATP-binding protein [Desulfohalovibrio reitneri]
MRQVFIETDNVSKFRRAVATMEDMEHGQPGIAVCWGQAGRGKTVAVQNYYSEHGGVYLYVWQDWTQCAFLQGLCFEICGQRPRSANDCKIKIVAALSKEPQTIFVDEADKLSVARINDLRDIHELTGSSIVLVGEEELPALLGQQRRVWSRVVQEVVFGPISESDVAMYGMDAADLRIPARECKLIVKKTDGDFRLVRNMFQMLENAAKARDTDTVDEAMVMDVLKHRSWRRS